MMRSNKLDEDIATLAMWIWFFHLAKAGVTPSFDLVSMSVDWDATCMARMRPSEGWQKVMVIAPVLPDFLLGDYLMDSFRGLLICQLCAVGMNLAPLQHYLLQRFECYGGHSMDDNPMSLVAWLLDTYVNGDMPEPVIEEAMAAHGDTLMTSSTDFLQQLGVISDVPPFRSASPLFTWADRLYYQTLETTFFIRRLRAALERLNVQIRSTKEYIQVQHQTIDILVDNMRNVSIYFT